MGPVAACTFPCNKMICSVRYDKDTAWLCGIFLSCLDTPSQHTILWKPQCLRGAEKRTEFRAGTYCQPYLCPCVFSSNISSVFWHSSTSREFLYWRNSEVKGCVLCVKESFGSICWLALFAFLLLTSLFTLWLGIRCCIGRRFMQTNCDLSMEAVIQQDTECVAKSCSFACRMHLHDLCKVVQTRMHFEHLRHLLDVFVNAVHCLLS